jgi:hypothetical protein
MATPKKRTAPKTPKTSATPAKAATPSETAAELQQLAAIRARHPPLSAAQSAALFALYTDEQCRDHGANTKARDTFRGAMSWARIIGERAPDAAIAPVAARWFLDCTTALGDALSGRVIAANPGHAGALSDAEAAAKKKTQRALRRLRDAAGGNSTHKATIDAAVTFDGVGNEHVQRATKIAALCKQWLATAGASPVAAFGIDDGTVAALEAAAATLSGLVATTPAARAIDRDSPEINAAEGRLLFAMRTLWDDAADAREDGTSSLLYTVSPAILRGLNLTARNKSAEPAKE